MRGVKEFRLYVAVAGRTNNRDIILLLPTVGFSEEETKAKLVSHYEKLIGRGASWEDAKQQGYQILKCDLILLEP